MSRIKLCMYFMIVLFCFLPMNLYAAEKNVVVIPLSSSGGQKEIYIPAPLFQPVDSFLGGTWQEDGSIVQPNGSGNWIAPLLLPTGTAIISLELFWKNNTYNTGVSTVVLHLLNLLNGYGAQTYTSSSNTATSGVQTVKLDTNNFVITENLKPSIIVYFSNTNRWLMGVKVVYR